MQTLERSVAVDALEEKREVMNENKVISFEGTLVRRMTPKVLSKR